MTEETEIRQGGEVEEGLTIKGDLRESGLPELLKSLTQNRETGILTLSRGGTDKSIHLKDGKILFAASTDPDDRLGEILLRSGKITLDEYFQSAHHIRPGKRQGSILVELGYINPDDLVRGVRDQVRHIVFSLFQWTEGDYKMLLKDLNTHDLITLNLSTPELVFEGIQTIQAWSRIYRGIGSSLDVVFTHAPEADNILYEMELGEDESHIYSLASGKISVHQMCSMSYLSNFETCRVLWGFVCLGALAPAREASQAEAEAGRDASRLDGLADRYSLAFEALAGAIGDASAFPDLLRGALRQTEPLHPEVLAHVSPETPIREAVGEAMRRIDGGEAGGGTERIDEALQELLFALLLLVRIKLGPEKERRASEAVTAVLHPPREG